MANGVTEFAAVQGVAFSIASTGKELAASLRHTRGVIDSLVLSLSTTIFCLISIYTAYLSHLLSAAERGRPYRQTTGKRQLLAAVRNYWARSYFDTGHCRSLSKVNRPPITAGFQD